MMAVHGLSKSQRRVLDLMLGGLSNDQIATEVGVSALTVKNYLSAILDTFDLPSRAAVISHVLGLEIARLKAENADLRRALSNAEGDGHAKVA